MKGNDMNNGASNTEIVSAGKHPFEAALLGEAPFRVAGFAENQTYQACPGAPVQPGGSCDYCSQGIYNWVYIKDRNGKRFKVGFDCAEKARPDYKGNSLEPWMDDPAARKLADQVRAAKRKLDKAKRDRKAEDNKAFIETSLADDAVRTKLAAAPHPRGFVDRATGAPLTFLDYVEWMLANAGASGRAKVATEIRRALK